MHTVIIGNGISGVTAARWVRKLSDHKITIISKESDHFFSRTALMYIYMGHMRQEDTKPYEDWFWEKNKINLVKAEVTGVHYASKSIELRGSGTIIYDKLVLAVGSLWNKFGWPGQDLNRVGGLYSLQDLEYMEAMSKHIKRATVVGGGLIGIEMAEMFLSRNIPVTFLVREESYWNAVLPAEESRMISNHIKEHHVDLRLGVNLGEILDDGQGNAGGVTIKETDEKIDCQWVGLTAGVRPNIDIFKETELEVQRGIMVNEFLETNIPDVYAIGDCAQATNPRPGRRPIEAVWYTGRMMGETVAHNVVGSRIEYNPGIWFNSAKFFDIEYQVYGEVLAKPPEHHKSLYWEHEDRKKSVRIVYDENTNIVLGFNLMGIRYRHEVCEKWIANKTNIEEVLQNLSLANFDPEFFKEHEQSVVATYNKLSGKNLSLKKKRKLSDVLQFLKA